MIEVQQVWRHNLEEAFDQIRDLVEDYPYVSINTLMPGIVARPITHFEYSYQTVKCNVDLLNVIQLGFSFANDQGECPCLQDHPVTVQFNFALNTTKDVQFQEFTDFMTRNGVDSGRAETEGIDPVYFGELMFSSGLVMNENIRWISYHGAYDFGFLLKTLTSTYLPATAQGFRDLLKDLFPKFYDVKSLASMAGLVSTGFITFRETCDIVGVTPEDSSSNMQRTAGTDAFNCGVVFFKLISQYFDNALDSKVVLSRISYGVDDALHLKSNVSPLLAKRSPSHRDPPLERELAPATHHHLLLNKSRGSSIVDGTDNSKVERLPPGMLRLKPSQISSFTKTGGSTTNMNPPFHERELSK